MHDILQGVWGLHVTGSKKHGKGEPGIDQPEGPNPVNWTQNLR